MSGVPTRVARRGDKLMVMWDPDSIYYECRVADVFVHKGKRFHDLKYADGDEEFYVDLHKRKWRFLNPDDNRLPRNEREQAHPEMLEEDYPKEGDEVEVEWHVDGKFYSGVVEKVTQGIAGALFHDIEYVNGDVEVFVDLCYRRWKRKGEEDLDEEEEERVRRAKDHKEFDESVATNVKRLFGS